MTEHLLAWEDVSLAAQTFGFQADPTVLLIAGGGQSMVWWEKEFCTRLAASGRHVIRYDHRDTGRSTSSPAGRPAYTAAELGSDPLLPFAHGEALARRIPGALLIPMDGMGHQQPPPSLWETALAAIARHTAGTPST